MLDADGVPVADATTIERGAGSPAVPVTMATPAAPQSASSAAIHDRAGLRVSPRAMSMKPPGDCTPNQHQRMQREVRRACDQPRRCIPGMTPAELLTRMERNRECAMARDIINKTCFAGGDLDHRNEAIRAWGLVARCESLSP
jgi:type VI secretion system secreted protein VgrG